MSDRSVKLNVAGKTPKYEESGSDVDCESKSCTFQNSAIFLSLGMQALQLIFVGSGIIILYTVAWKFV